MRKIQFSETEIYHIYNRGVDKRDVFLDEKDYLRFIHDLFEFNDMNPVMNANYYFSSNSRSFKISKPRKLLVEILIFTLMPNHFHLVLRQLAEKGIKMFMHKMGTGYTMYFNNKYERNGALFQGRFKAKVIDENQYFSHIPFYIHANPLKLNYGGSTSIDYLKNYRWSSFRDYIGKRNFPSLISKGFILDYFRGEKEYEKEFIKWLNMTNYGG